MIADIDKRILRHLGKIRLAFRGIGTRVNSAPKVQLVQGDALSGEQLQAAEYMQHYGFTSKPPPGFMYVAVPVGGKTAHAIIVATEHATYRLKNLADGELAIYDDQGQKVHIKRDRVVVETPFTFEVIADKIKLHATSEFTFDVNGHGQKWLPTKVDTWQIGEVAGTAHAIAPPRIP